MIISPMCMEEKLYQIGLSRIPGVGHKTLKVLVAYCGGARQVYEASRKELLKIPGIGPTLIPRLRSKTGLEEAGRELSRLERMNVQPLFFTDAGYPKRLLHFPDCPVLLYKKGTANLNATRILSIVGTRKPTPAGKTLCESIVHDLKPFKAIIVSGMAYGIDICAHRQSLHSGLETIAVMANGMGREYPAVHRGVAQRIVRQGALLTEIPPGVEAEREFFPMRNRIIAGMCDGLLVVETAEKGGSMISADLANGYHKEVFAIPGHPTSRTAAGCNLLIKSHRARLVESARDIAEALGWDEQPDSEGKQQELFETMDPEFQKLLGVLSRSKPVHIDALALQTGKSTSEVSAMLLDLECRNLVKNLPGNRFTLL